MINRSCGVVLGTEKKLGFLCESLLELGIEKLELGIDQFDELKLEMKSYSTLMKFCSLAKN